MPRLRLPDLYIVGAQKAGTTSLYYWLAQHPEVYGRQDTKDFPFFADEKLYGQGIERFARCFTGVSNQRYLMAGSVQYLFFSVALERICSVRPDAKILVLVRDPVARAISAYRYAVQRGLEPRSFDDSVAMELSADNRDQAYSVKVDRFQKYYVARGLYGEQLLRLYRMFPPNQVFVGIFEDMIANPDLFTERLLTFLGLDNVWIEFGRSNTTSGTPRSRLVSRLFYNKAIRDSWAMEQLKRLIPHPIRFRIRRLVVSMNTDRRRDPAYTMVDTTKQKLQVVFRDDLKTLRTPEADAWRLRWGLDSCGQGRSTPA
jgi:hypothetical protein